ncbi:MAG: T9SS type A sorting domain-containing protein, partial [Candidatus Cloacimonetes bacterium]|nr:T9SS type A sorting domain-containing protein [Candidatus Cloacimonadota bacterium]
SGPCVVAHSGSYEYVPVLNDILPRVVGIVDFAYDGFRIEPRDDNDFLPVSAENSELEITNYNLQNYPNPFNPSTTISFDIIDANSFVTIEIFNVKGQLVKQLGITNYELGVNQVTWNAENFSSGIYFYKLVVDGKLVDTKKMILMK